MATTQLFAELLVIGVGAAIWLAILLAAVLGYHLEAGVPAVGPAVLAALSGVAYVLGIVVDRFARRHSAELNGCCRSVSLGKGGLPTPHTLEREILAASKTLGSQIQYNRSRFRICRAWVFNGGLITLTFIGWNLRVRGIGPWQASFLAALGVLFCAALAWAARTLAEDHYNNLKESHDFLRSRRSLPLGN
jgi:hypothetical protein